jgi:hypothetical protein
MTRQDKRHFTQKHAPECRADRRISEALKRQAPAGELTCSQAFAVAANLNVPPAEVGLALDLNEIRLTECQLGLFGYRPQKKKIKPAEKVPSEMREAILQSAADSRLPCKAAWQIADRLGLTKLKISSACEKLKIKISACQLGAF